MRLSPKSLVPASENTNASPQVLGWYAQRDAGPLMIFALKGDNLLIQLRKRILYEVDHTSRLTTGFKHYNSKPYKDSKRKMRECLFLLLHDKWGHKPCENQIYLIL